MKTHITKEQYDELSELGKENFLKFFKPAIGDMIKHPDYEHPEALQAPQTDWNDIYINEAILTPSLTSLIDFLVERFGGNMNIQRRNSGEWLMYSDFYMCPQNENELVDLCWTACKYFLEKQNDENA